MKSDFLVVSHGFFLFPISLEWKMFKGSCHEYASYRIMKIAASILKATWACCTLKQQTRNEVSMRVLEKGNVNSYSSLLVPFNVIYTFLKEMSKKTEWRIMSLRKSFWKFWLLFNKHQFSNTSLVHERPHPNQWNQWESSQLASAGLSQQKCN